VRGGCAPSFGGSLDRRARRSQAPAAWRALRACVTGRARLHPVRRVGRHGPRRLTSLAAGAASGVRSVARLVAAAVMLDPYPRGERGKPATASGLTRGGPGVAGESRPALLTTAGERAGLELPYERRAGERLLLAAVDGALQLRLGHP
jgi:hypothetical protein